MIKFSMKFSKTLLIIIFTYLFSCVLVSNVFSQNQAQIENHLYNLISSTKKLDYEKFKSIYMPSEKLMKDFFKKNAEKDNQFKEIYETLYNNHNAHEYRISRIEYEKEIMNRYAIFIESNSILFDEKNYKSVEFYSSKGHDNDIPTSDFDIDLHHVLLVFKGENSTFITFIEYLIEYKGRYYFGTYQSTYVTDDNKSEIIQSFNKADMQGVKNMIHSLINKIHNPETETEVITKESQPVITTKTYKSRINDIDYTFEISNNDYRITEVRVFKGDEDLSSHTTFYAHMPFRILVIHMKSESILLNLAKSYSGNYNGSLHEYDSNVYLSKVTLNEIVK